MRTSLLAALLAPILGSTTMAGAEDSISATGTYDVKYEEVSTNCGENKLAYKHGKLRIEMKASQLLVDIDRTPVMVGAPPKGGKLSAKSRMSETMLMGMKGVFSVAGRVTADGQLRLVMIGEYTANGKPLCSQSWNVSGPRATTAVAPEPPKK